MRRPAILFYCAWSCAALGAGGALAAVEIRSVASVEFVRPRDAADPTVFDAARVRRFLRPLVGRPCDEAAIEETLARPYRFLGYVPSIEAACDEGSVAVTIRESSHVVHLITFEAGDLARLGLSVSGEVDPLRPLYPVPPDAPRALLRALLKTREGDLYNVARYREDRDALEQVGYTVAFIAGPPGDDGYPRGAYLVQALAPSPRAAADRRSQYLGGTASYGPQRKGALGILYRKQGLLGTFDRLSLSPGFNAALGGDVSYVAPLFGSRQEPRTLYDLDLRLFSDFLNDRRLRGVEVDQRQTGASIALGARPLRRRGRHDLRLHAGVRHESIALDGDVPGEEEERLSMLQLGASWEWRHVDRWPSLSAHLAPDVDLALDTAGGERTFVRPSLDASLHARRLSGVEYDARLLAALVDRDVPSFELWSLGGPRTVRGFREDEFLGRRLAALQAEIWLPFARTLESRPVAASGDDAELLPVESRAARRLKWALFVDGGFMTGREDGGRVALAGAGIGLRFIVPRRPLVVRVDYGWGLGGRGGGSHPYVALGYVY